MVRIISEIGSTHMGKKKLCLEAVDRCLEMGVDAIKFQLFPNKPPFVGTGNIWLDPELFLETKEYAEEHNLSCSASVFDEESFDFLVKSEPDFIKFAYSQKHQDQWIEETLCAGIEAIVSCDIMSSHKVHKEAKKLFCIAQYPVYFEVSFDEIFPKFWGFSDHTLGFSQTLTAVLAGAKAVEKHMKLSQTADDCPDSLFALSPGEFAAMVATIRRAEREYRL